MTIIAVASVHSNLRLTTSNSLQCNADGPGMRPVKNGKGQVKVKTASSRSIGSGASSCSFDDDTVEVYLTKDDSSSLYPMGVRVRLGEDQIDAEPVPQERKSGETGKLVDAVDFGSCGFGLGLA